MNCPQCKVPMLVVEYDDIELDHCALCEGTWFDRDELRLLLVSWRTDVRLLLPEHVESLPEAQCAEEKRQCPICGGTMRKVLLGTEPRVLIDACPAADGLWFADREVVQLAQQLLVSMPPVPGKAMEFMGRVFPDSGSEEQEGEAE